MILGIDFRSGELLSWIQSIMSDDENSNVIIPTMCAVAVLVFLVFGFLMYTRPVSVTAPTPFVSYSSTPSTASTPAQPVVRVMADAQAPDRTAELQYDGRTYAPDQAGLAALTKDLEAVSDGSGISLVCDASLSVDSVNRVMGAITLSDLKESISLGSEPEDPAKVTTWLKGTPEE